MRRVIITLFLLWLCCATHGEHLRSRRITRARLATRLGLDAEATLKEAASLSDIQNSKELALSKARIFVIDDAIIIGLVLAGGSYLVGKGATALGDHYQGKILEYAKAQQDIMAFGYNVTDRSQANIKSLFLHINTMALNLIEEFAGNDRLQTSLSNPLQEIAKLHIASESVLGKNHSCQVKNETMIQLLNKIADGIDKASTAVTVAKYSLHSLESETGRAIISEIAGGASGEILSVVGEAAGVTDVVGGVIPFISYGIHAGRIGYVLTKMNTEEGYKFGEEDIKFLEPVMYHATNATIRDYCRTVAGVKQMLDVFFANFTAALDSFRASPLSLKEKRVTWEASSRKLIQSLWKKEQCGCRSVPDGIVSAITQTEDIVDLKIVLSNGNQADTTRKYRSLVTDKWELVLGHGTAGRDDGKNGGIKTFYNFRDASIEVRRGEEKTSWKYKEFGMTEAQEAVKPFAYPVPCEMNPWNDDLVARNPDDSMTVWVKRRKNDRTSHALAHIITVQTHCENKDHEASIKKKNILDQMGYRPVAIDYVDTTGSASRTNGNKCHDNPALEDTKYDISKGGHECCGRVQVWIKRAEQYNGAGIRHVYLGYGSDYIPPENKALATTHTDYKLTYQSVAFGNVFCIGCAFASNGHAYVSRIWFEQYRLIGASGTYLTDPKGSTNQAQCKGVDRGVGFTGDKFPRA